jgi:uncharacterized membrane protein YuzA (DUF378 family)
MSTTTTPTTTTTDKKWDVTTILIALYLTLTIVGALNWGTTAYGYNLVELVAGKDTAFSKVVYSLVALSGLLLIVSLFTKKLKLKC